MAQPFVDEAKRVARHGRLDPAATVVAAHDDVFDLQHFHRVLEHAEHVEVGVDHQIGHIAVDEYFARVGLCDLVGWHPAVGTPDPEVIGLLDVDQAGEIVRVLLNFFVRPVFIGGEESFVLFHGFSCQHCFDAMIRQVWNI